MVVRVIFAAGTTCNPADITMPVTVLALTVVVLINLYRKPATHPESE